MENNTDKELFMFLNEELNVNIDEYSPNFDLNKDLNVYGEDAIEFLEKFGEKFNVNLDNFNFEKYFNPEIDKISLFFRNIFIKNNPLGAIIFLKKSS